MALRPMVDRLEARALLATGGLTLTALTILAPVHGTTGLIKVASFSDATGNQSSTASQYLAAINWGDGTVSPGVVKILPVPQNVGGSIGPAIGQIAGAHTYDQPGSYTVVVGIAKDAASNYAITTSTAVGTTILGARTLDQSPIAVGTGTTTGPVSVAAFVDPTISFTPPPDSTYQVAINWGDGSFTGGVARVVGGSNGASGFNAIVDAQGAHTYFSPGIYGVVVALVRSGVVYSYTELAVVTGPAIPGAQLLPNAPPMAIAGRSTGPVTVATFVDPDPTSIPPDAGTYSTFIAWGDGTYSQGAASIVSSVTHGGVTSVIVNVEGEHTYASTGVYALVVALSRPGQVYSSTEFAQIT